MFSICHHRRPDPVAIRAARALVPGRLDDSDLAAALVYTTYPLEGADDGTDVSVDVEKFPAVFAHDVDPDLARVLAASQRPLAALAFSETASAAAWKTKPAWASVSSSDHTINPDVERFGYERAGATTIEIDSSHLVMLAHPDDVVALIHQALTAVSGS